MHEQDNDIAEELMVSVNPGSQQKPELQCQLESLFSSSKNLSMKLATWPNLPQSHRNGPAEQSFAQGRLWFLSRLHPQSAWYHTPVAVRLRGPLQINALHRALQALEERHESLRTTFTQHDGVGLQVVQPFEPKKLEIIDMAGATRDALQQALHREQTTPFNLETEPGWRTSILRLGEEDHVLSIVMHHIITDGWSIGIIQRELAMFYSAACQGKEPLSQVRPLPIQYRDFAVWQRQEAQKAEHQRQLEYWKRQLDGSQPAEFLYDKPRPIYPSGSAGIHKVNIDGDLYQNLVLFCKKNRKTLFTVLLTAFRAAHFRLTGNDDATIGIPAANRNRKELEDIVGFFVNLQCIRITVNEEENESFDSLICQVSSTLANASANQDVPFERIVAAVQHRSRELSRNPLVQTIFSLHAQSHVIGFHSAGLETEEEVAVVETTRFDLEFHCFQEAHCLRLCILYSTDLFNPSSITVLTSTYLEILRRGLEHPEEPLASMSLTDGIPPLIAMGLTQVIQTDYPRNSSIVELFRQQVSLSQEILAVKDASAQLNYAELDRKSDQVAYWLAKQGFHAETLVAVLAPRSCEAIVTFLGILKANLAYLPLDVNIPIGRLQSILSEVKGHTLVLMGAGLAIPDKGPADAEFLYISAIEEQQAAVPQAAAVLPTPSATSLAYVMFTSGSTGRPKGVMIEHRGIVRLVKNSNVASQSQVAVPIAHIANLAFDAATWEIYAALLNGGSLICIDHMTVLDIPSLCQLFKREEIRAAMFTPAFLKQCLATAPEIVANLDILFTAGDRVNLRDVIFLRTSFHGDFINAYGPTENTTFSTIHRIDSDNHYMNGIPIGQSISNSGALIMDPRQALVPLGIMGEIVLFGDGLARGYIDPVLDRGQFIQVTVNGNLVRAYRTGDRARYRPLDGQIEFFGRMDHQIKIRGHRIELEEVEKVLLRHSLVSDAVVLARESEGHETGLVGFVTIQRQPISDDDDSQFYLEHGDRISLEHQTYHEEVEAHLRSALQVTLPSYMIPARIVPLDRMPLNAHGKVDRRALCQLSLVSSKVRLQRVISPPRNTLERTVCEEFAQVLSLEVGIHDNFFNLGGHSLTAIEMVSKIRKRLKRRVVLRDLYQHSTPESLCIALGSAERKRINPDDPSSFTDMHRRNNSAATLVLIHGFWGSGDVFSHLVPLVDGNFDTIVMHDPFFGEQDGPHTVQDWATFYCAALNRLVLSDRPIFLGGYSFGGLIALQMASLWPALCVTSIASVILLDPGTFESINGYNLGSSEMEKELRYAVRLFGQDMKANILQQLAKLRPLMLSLRELPQYSGSGLYVSTDETAELGVSKWWVDNYGHLQMICVGGTHHNLLRKSTIKELGEVVNQHCCRILKELNRKEHAVGGRV